MRFLVDQQLPRALAHHLTSKGHFRISHLLSGRPARLLHVTCGNISTRDLLALVDKHYAELESALSEYDYVELDRAGVIVHDPR